MRDEEVREAFREFVLDLLSFSFTGKVEAVDEQSLTATVRHGDLPYTANFKSIVDDKQEGLWMVPAVGSDVFCVPEGQSKERFMIVKYSKIDRIYFEIGNTKCNVTGEKIVLNDGNNGGVAISQKVIDEIKGIKDDLNSLKNKITAWVPIANDGGAKLKADLATWLTGTLPDPDPNVIINTKVQH
ncbi:MAG: hypothetical protein JEZ14_15125 [Marinilabiliaceae bacterium]|nr:hypothetical protein [Marinilabiliaceae bacterium]